ncbi:MAG: alpha/beta hydrolase [Pseudomonadota bacterium]
MRTTSWRDLAPEALEAHLNPRAAVGNDRAERYLQGFADRADSTRHRLAGTFDVRYGTSPKSTFDVFRPEGRGPFPAFVFVHGGYWRALDKREHAFVVEPAVARGFAGIVMNYDLCPEVTLDHIVEQTKTCIRFLAAERTALGFTDDGLAMAGHSAGAHLIALMLHHDWRTEGFADDPIRWAGLWSGIYEPEAVRHISVNDDVRLVSDMAERNDAMTRLPCAKPIVDVTVGALEPTAWIDQSQRYAAACRAAGLDATLTIIDDADHFSLLEHPILPPSP